MPSRHAGIGNDVIHDPPPRAPRPLPPDGIALALGPGGARGLAHIVVLEVLDAFGLKPNVIAGCSMGAVVGAAYAAGMPARDIRVHALRVLRNRRLLLGRMLEARVGKFTDLLRGGLVNPVMLDAEAILPAFLPEAVPATFEGLELPLQVVATDFHAREAVTIAAGDLRSAVAGSIAIPGLIRPVLREGRVLVDGGVVDPLPYERLFDVARLVLACDVSPGPPEPREGSLRPFEVMLGATQIMQATLTARMLRARPPHILVRPPVERFRLLAFFHASRVLEAADGLREELKRDLDAALTAIG